MADIPPPGLLEQILVAPWIWIVISLIVIYFIVTRYNRGTKSDPSTKPWWGRTVRRDLMKKEQEKRMDVLGRKCKVEMEKGIARIGMVEQIEYDKMLMYKLVTDPKTKAKHYAADYYYRVDRLKFRKFGAWARLKSWFGAGYSYMVITPDSYTTRVDKKRRIFNIDPTVHLLNDSGVWTVSNPRAINSNDEFLLKAHDENIHGSEIDFLRRLAVHSPTVASSMEKESHTAKLEEDKRRSRIAPYS